MTAGKVHKIVQGKVVECSAEKPSECTPLPQQPAGLDQAKSAFIADGELFALSEGGVACHYQWSKSVWESFDFDYIDYCTHHGCQEVYRHPVSMRTEDRYLIVELDNNESERAPILKDEMRGKFVPHGERIVADNIEEGLSQIGLFTKIFKYNDGSKALHDRWEKKQAVTFLEGYRNKSTDLGEKKNIERAIEQLKADQENNRVVFCPTEALDENHYCDSLKCIPVLKEEPFYNRADVATGLMFNQLPFRRNIKISSEQWHYISLPLQRDPGSSDAEREALKEVARRWELVLASKIGTGYDIGGWTGNFLNFVPFAGVLTGQTSCNEETTNNIALLQALQTAGYLRYHSFDPARMLETLGGLHQSVRFEDQRTNIPYVLDTWPMGNGQTPIVSKAADWNFITVWPYNNLPTGESLAQSNPWHKLGASLLGLGASYLFSRNGIGNRAAALTAVMPEGQVEEFLSSPGAKKFKVTTYRRRLTGGYPSFVNFERRAVRDDFRHLFPREYIGRRLSREYFSVKPSSLPIHAPIDLSAMHYLRGAKGALNFGAAVLLATELASVPFSVGVDGIPDSEHESRLGATEQLLTYATAGYLGAEGALAIRFGTTPLLYEVPVAGVPMLVGGVAGSGMAHAVGVYADMPTFQYGGRGNTIVGLAGGAAAVAGAKKMLGQNIWQAMVQSVEKNVVNYAGRAGLWLEAMIQSSIRLASQEVLPVLIGVINGLSRFFTPILIPNPEKFLNPHLDQKIEV